MERRDLPVAQRDVRVRVAPDRQRLMDFEALPEALSRDRDQYLVAPRSRLNTLQRLLAGLVLDRLVDAPLGPSRSIHRFDQDITTVVGSSRPPG